ncbi:6361_t:CDS:1 [Acaulospora morrowiae]|uniref:6361_t:CDS:1 n=1 Tax=Acaulospora morrowiae TaxID=94023 RepID=A0A9N9G2X6_9GLOM|nr:6361_t:CDS:1 [Acaulospora morrowiae]
MVSPSQSINAWIENNLFQDFATMPTSQVNSNSSTKQANGGKIEAKEKFMKRRITRSMTQKALDVERSISNHGSTVQEITEELFSDDKNQGMHDKKGNNNSELEGNDESFDDLEEQTAAAQVLQLLGRGDVPGSNSDSNILNLEKSEFVKVSEVDNKIPTFEEIKWCPKEDELSKNSILNFGLGKCKEITSTISGRIDDQCKERWDSISIQHKSAHPSPLQEIEEAVIDHSYFETEWGTFSQKLSDNHLDPDSTSTAQTHVDISIDWSSVMDPSLLPVTLSNHGEPGTKIVLSPSQSSKRRHSSDTEENVEEFITKDDRQIGDSLEAGLSADLLITAMTENPQFFYQSATNDYSEVSYAAGPESFLISGDKEDISSDSANTDKDLNDLSMGSHSVKRRKTSISDLTSRRHSQSTNGDGLISQLGYECTQCNKTFARLYNLKSHQRTHSTDRPFKCPSCETAFARNHDLKRHQKIHENAKPYKCLGCKKLFSRFVRLMQNNLNKGQGFLTMNLFDNRLDALRRHKQNPKSRESCRESEIAASHVESPK